MKKRLTVCSLVLLLLMVNIALPVSAELTSVEVFVENGVTYAWVIGDSNPDALPDATDGYHWEAVTKLDNQGRAYHETYSFGCPYKGKNHTHTLECLHETEFRYICGKEEHTCRMPACVTNYIGYKYIMKENEREPILIIVGKGPAGEPIIDCEYVLLREEFIKDDNGDDKLISHNVLYNGGTNSNASTQVNENGVALLHLDPEKMDPNAEYEKLVLGQIMNDGTYRPLSNRWYVTVLRNDEGIYELYSIIKAPNIPPNTPADLPSDHYELGEAGFAEVQNYFSERTKTLTITNEYLLGTIGLVIKFEGFHNMLPVEATGAVSITDGPTPFYNKFTRSETLRDVRMGTYKVTTEAPSVPNYEFVSTKIQLQSESSAPFVDYDAETGVTLSKGSMNAVVTVTYTYEAICAHEYAQITVAPTCTEDGYTAEKCTKCGEETNIEPILAAGHDMQTVTKDSTCTEDGYTVERCAKCGNENGEREPIAASGHDYKVEIKESTCTEKGYTAEKCAKCGDEKNRVEKNATGHTYTDKVTDPTCTKKGYTTRTCSVCGYFYDENEVAALGHKYTSQTVEPTIEREGFTVHTCSVCGDSYTDNIKDKLTSDQNSDNENDAEEDNKADNDKEDDKSESNNTNNNNNNIGNKTENENNTIATDPANTIIVKAVDDLDRPLMDTEIALYSGKSKVASWKSTYENLFVLDNLQKYVKEGESITYTLVQTKAPDGYELSEDSFTVKISNRNGKTEVDVKKNVGGADSIFKGNGIEIGNDGKQVITFYNMRKTTQIELSCQVSIEFDENSWVDEAIAAEYQRKQHEFVLAWKDSDGEEQTETVMLAHGEIGLLEAELPFDTEYAITVVDPEGTLITDFSENAAGTITPEQVQSNMAVEAAVKYAVQAEKLMLSIVVVEGETKRPVEGVTFDLKNPDGLKIGTFTSREGGEIFITDVFAEPGDYLLTQTQSPEGYELMKGAVPIIISAEYGMSAEEGPPVLVQTMAAILAHQSVVQETDGSYWLEIARSEGAEPAGSERTGMNIGAMLGIVGGLVVVAGGVTAFVLIRKKHRAALG